MFYVLKDGRGRVLEAINLFCVSRIRRDKDNPNTHTLLLRSTPGEGASSIWRLERPIEEVLESVARATRIPQAPEDPQEDRRDIY